MKNVLEASVNRNAYFVPVATNENRGIASFYDAHFDVINGKVFIKQKYINELTGTLVNLKEFSEEIARIRALLDNRYTKQEIDSMFGSYVTNMANLIGGEALD